jgi:hypothetical protein
MNVADKNAIRARIALIATERGLPESEIKKAMGRLLTRDVLRFARKHRVNMDWLICGDLKGLLETARGCPSRPQQPTIPEDESFRKYIDTVVDEKLARGPLPPDGEGAA